MENSFLEKRKEHKKEEKENGLLQLEGELTVDVYQTEKELVIQSAIAGVKIEDLDISIEGDKVTIRGKRERPPESGERNYFYQECYWGPFFREIILPVEIDPSRAKASLKEGILTIRMPKIEKEKKRKIEVKT
jgi:HSP20 family protein